MSRGEQALGREAGTVMAHERVRVYLAAVRAALTVEQELGGAVE